MASWRAPDRIVLQKLLALRLFLFLARGGGGFDFILPRSAAVPPVFTLSFPDTYGTTGLSI
jgi:hypothetical protein